MKPLLSTVIICICSPRLDTPTLTSRFCSGKYLWYCVFQELQISCSVWFCNGLLTDYSTTHDVTRCVLLAPCADTDLGWGLLSRFAPFRYFPNFSTSPKYVLAIEYHIHNWQVLPQLSCGDTYQIWIWFKEYNRCLCKIENFTYGEINERSFSNPHPPGQPLTQAMVYCLTAPCHCRSQYWLIIKIFSWDSPEASLTGYAHGIYRSYMSNNCQHEITTAPPRDRRSFHNSCSYWYELIHHPTLLKEADKTLFVIYCGIHGFCIGHLFGSGARYSIN